MIIELVDNKWFENPVLIDAFVNFCDTYGFQARVADDGDGFTISSPERPVDEEVFEALPRLFELSFLTDIVFNDILKIRQ